MKADMNMEIPNLKSVSYRSRSLALGKKIVGDRFSINLRPGVRRSAVTFNAQHSTLDVHMRRPEGRSATTQSTGGKRVTVVWPLCPSCDHRKRRVEAANIFKIPFRRLSDAIIGWERECTLNPSLGCSEATELTPELLPVYCRNTSS